MAVVSFLKSWQLLVVVLLFVNIVSEVSSTSATCPCVEGGQWTYKGRQQSYCTNPNNGRTSWCAKTVKTDGEYDAFSWCQGDELKACQDLKDALEPATCPCVAGGSWRFEGKLQSYCSNPSGSKMDWCATEVSSSGSFNGNFAWCTDDVKAACDTLKESKPKPICPCVAGGQWKYQGKKYSYCNNPGDKSRTVWCPRSVDSTGDYTGNLDFAYCEAEVLEACKVIEGLSPPEDQCPCVEGGQWNYNGVSHSYCEGTTWCASSTDENGNYIGKYAMCTGKVKETCGRLQSLKTEQGKNDVFAEFTEAGTGCACWFDMERTDCACCKEEAVQCGAPMQNYCYKKTEGRERGCPGVPSAQWTLSTTGHPCLWNRSRTDCAWCARGGSQCGEDDIYGPSSSLGAQCVDSRSDICDLMSSDCRQVNICDPKADCVYSKKWGSSKSIHTCQCSEGWTGNGIQCFNSTTGEASVASGSDDLVTLEIGITTDFYIFPHNSSEFPLGQPEKNMLDGIKELFESGESCDASPGCNATMLSTETIK